MNTVKVYVSGWYEYRIDNPTALIDASAYTPQELDPNNVAGLQDVPPAFWQDLRLALVTEVSKLRLQSRLADPPGATMVDQKVSYSPGPPAS